MQDMNVQQQQKVSTFADLFNEICAGQDESLKEPNKLEEWFNKFLCHSDAA